MTGQIECLVFPRVFERYQALLQEDEAVVLSGKISVREEEAPKLLADRVERLEDWVKRTREKEQAAQTGTDDADSHTHSARDDAQIASRSEHKLFLRLNREKMDQVNALLALETGDVPVYLHLPEEKTTLLCPRSNWTGGSERTLARLRDALGDGNVVLK